MDNFVPPSVDLSVKLITTYSVSAAVAINILGFVVAAFHYSKLGVSLRSLPLLGVWGAGLSFCVLTVFFLHAGYASWHLAKSTQPLEALAYSTTASLLLFLLAMFLLRYAGAFTYCAVCFLLGVAAASGKLNAVYIPRISESSVKIFWPAVGFVSLLGVVWAYTVMVYPNLARSLGGAAPHPIRLVLKSGWERVIAKGSRVYDVLATDNALFVEVVLPSGAAPKKPRKDMFWFRRFDPPATYMEIPRAAVKYVEYTDTFDEAPLVEDGNESTSEEVDLPPSVPTPAPQPPADNICLPPGATGPSQRPHG